MQVASSKLQVTCALVHWIVIFITSCAYKF